ncbi:MAG TPA: DMT family transporter [Thermotogota bacterium]|nr:DMT family transporter [Thermotogota bacterium]
MKKKAYIYMIITTLIWGGSYVVGKATVNEFPPITLTFFRFLISAIIILPIMIKTEGKRAKLSLKDLPLMLLIAFSGGFGYSMMYFFSLVHTTAIKSAMIVAINPLTTLLLSALILKEQLSFIKVGSILLALFGVMITITDGFQVFSSGFTLNPGDLIMLSAVCLYSFYSVISHKIMKKYSPVILTGYSFIISMFCMIPIVWNEKPFELWMNASLNGKLSVIYLGAFASAIAYLLHQISIKHLGASKSMSFYSLVPIFTAIFSIIFLNENLSLSLILGGAAILSGIYLNYNYKGRKNALNTVE